MQHIDIYPGIHINIVISEPIDTDIVFLVHVYRFSYRNTPMSVYFDEAKPTYIGHIYPYLPRE